MRDRLGQGKDASGTGGEIKTYLRKQNATGPQKMERAQNTPNAVKTKKTIPARFQPQRTMLLGIQCIGGQGIFRRKSKSQHGHHAPSDGNQPAKKKKNSVREKNRPVKMSAREEAYLDQQSWGKTTYHRKSPGEKDKD